jgi:hypothetical protein
MDGWDARQVLSRLYGPKRAEYAFSKWIMQGRILRVRSLTILRSDAVNASLACLEHGEITFKHSSSMQQQQQQQQTGGSEQIGATRSCEAREEANCAELRTRDTCRESERLAYVPKTSVQFVADIRRRQLKKVDEEMEAVRFFGRSKSSAAPALEFLSQQRATAAASLHRGEEETELVGIEALRANFSVAQEVAHVFKAASNSAAAASAGRAVSRGLGGARSKSAIPGRISVMCGTNPTSVREFPHASSPSSPDGGEVGLGSKKSIAPLLARFRHAKRWEQEPFSNLITFALDDVTGWGMPKSKNVNKSRTVRGPQLKEDDEQNFKYALPSLCKCKVKESAGRLRHALQLSDTFTSAS